jgi:quinoprotein glucose dehydrogenase
MPTIAASESRSARVGIVCVVFVAATALTLATGGATAQDRPLGELDTSDGQRRSISVWAEPGLTRSPVSFTISPDGRLWLAESDRAGNAVTDTRQLGHLDAVWEDGQLRTVEDRRRLIDRWIAGGHFEPEYFTRTEDRVRMVADTDGDGVADASSVFAGGFNDALDGIGAGLVWVGDDLLYTNIPHLWRLRDIDGDGRIATDPGAG